MPAADPRWQLRDGRSRRRGPLLSRAFLLAALCASAQGARAAEGPAAPGAAVQKVGERFVDRQRRQRARHPPMLPVIRDTQTGHTTGTHNRDTKKLLVEPKVPDSNRKRRL